MGKVGSTVALMVLERLVMVVTERAFLRPVLTALLAGSRVHAPVQQQASSARCPVLDHLLAHVEGLGAPACVLALRPRARPPCAVRRAPRRPGRLLGRCCVLRRTRARPLDASWRTPQMAMKRFSTPSASAHARVGCWRCDWRRERE